MNLDQHQQLVQNLRYGPLANSSGEPAELVQTHISSVLIQGDTVYKLKKPLDLGFLDFSTLEKRHHYCAEEVRLNQRLSPALYDTVIAIYGTPQVPTLDEQGPVLEYAVRMRRFDQDCQFDELLRTGNLDSLMVSSFAEYLAEFHQQSPTAAADSDYGRPQQVWQPMAENFRQIRELVSDQTILVRLEQVESWSKKQFERLADILSARKDAGYVRQCHGDLHLRNLAWVDGKPLAFDCIEFEPALYWIDVINDLAFLWMDLHYRARPDLAYALLNSYLQVSSDYESLALLPFYAVYRAMVRAKIAAINLHYADSSSVAEGYHKDLTTHIELARNLSQPADAMICLMYGPSGSGKSHVARLISPALRAVVVRSDAVRKQLFKIPSTEHAGAPVKQGIYTSEASRHTYQKLLEHVRTVTRQGYAIIVDATFNQPVHRQPFIDFARAHEIPLFILELKVPETILRERVVARRHDISDADVDVLQHQLKTWQPLQEDERRYAIEVDAEGVIDVEKLVEEITHRKALFS